MFNVLATSPFVNYFRAYYELFGAPGLFAGALFFAVLVVCSFSRKGTSFLFILFLIASMLSATDKEAAARTAAISVFRYLLLFPLAFWGLLSLLFFQKKVGVTGWLLLLYCLLFIPGWFLNDYVGSARLWGQFLMWFAIVGFLSAQLTDIDKLKQFLAGLGWMSWVLVVVGVLFIFISPSESFMGGRLRSFWVRPNSLGMTMFFVVVVLAFRVFLLDQNYYRTLDIVCLFAAMIMLVMSGTRAAGFGAAIVLFPFIRGKSFKYYLLTALVFVSFLGIVIMVPSLQEMAVRRFIPTSEMDTAGRAERWAYGWQFALQNPVFGHGLNDDLEVNPAGVHNSFIAISVVGGVTNLMLFILICLTALLGSLTKARQHINAVDRKLCHHILFTIIATLFICFFESFAIGIGGAGITIIWLVFQCTNSLTPSPGEQTEYWAMHDVYACCDDEAEAECPVY